ncbi:copper amine oxidase N-terminal domain-containing protein [Paenibacillus sp. FSL R5-0623]|uniref:copper amine oxidase N-terminal domain-containing protein n=1 Tax=Paenibacillus sp. FSL R5-0623 TaxID=2921651 RepID=UPI0030D76AF1
MNKQKKMITSVILSAILLLVCINVVMAAQSTKTLYVDGIKIAKTEGQPVERTETLFVPIEAVVGGMGDKLIWIDEQHSALITKKDGTKINVYLGKSSVIVDGKAVPIATKVINTVTVPVAMKPAQISGKLYVPVEFLKEVMGYDVEVTEEGNAEFVIVGKTPANLEPVEDVPVTPTQAPTPTSTPSEWKPDLKYPVSAEWSPPQIRSTSTDDFQKDKAILEKELGFLKGYMYNIHGITNMEVGNKIIVRTHSEYYVDIQFSAWYGDKTAENDANKIPYIGRELFNFFLPDEYMKLFNIVQDGADGKNIDKYMKPFTLDGRKINIVNSEGSFSIQIGHKKK